MKRNTKSYKIIFSWTGVVILLVVLAFILESYIEQWKRKTQIASEVQLLRNEKENLFQANKQLEENLKFLGTSSYKSKMARGINMKIEGEEVIIFPENFNVIKNPENNSEKKEATSNPRKWWNYFMNPHSQEK